MHCTIHLPLPAVPAIIGSDIVSRAHLDCKFPVNEAMYAFFHVVWSDGAICKQVQYGSPVIGSIPYPHECSSGRCKLFCQRILPRVGDCSAVLLVEPNVPGTAALSSSH